MTESADGEAPPLHPLCSRNGPENVSAEGVQPPNFRHRGTCQNNIFSRSAAAPGWVVCVCLKRRPHEVSKQNIWFWSQLFTLFILLLLWWISIVFTVKHCIWKRFPSVQQTSKQWFTLQQRLSWCQRWLKGVHHLTLLLITEWTWSLTGRFERFDCCVCNTMLFIHWQSGCQASQSDTSAGTLLKTPARRFLH